MRVLLDTHALLWWGKGSPRLSAEAKEVLVAADEVRVSLVSVWELATKEAIGKLDVILVDFLTSVLAQLPPPLSPTIADCLHYAGLPRHHRDPFDRMLVAQAAVGGFTLMTDDDRLAMYRVPIVGCS